MQPDDLTPDDLMNLDRVIHEPARLLLLGLLFVAEEADFLYLQQQSGLTAGNLSAHLRKLEAAEYITIEKGYLGRKPHTRIRLTEQGRVEFSAYRAKMQQMLGGKRDNGQMG